jgi:hypothetical protein
MLAVTMGHGVYVRNYSIFVSDLHRDEVDWMDLIWKFQMKSEG